MSIFRPLFAGALALPLLAGCLGGEFPSIATPPGPDAVNPYATQQFILKFSDGRDERATRESLPSLESAAGLPLVYVRPMSGEAHVLRFPDPATPAQVEQALERLRQLAVVEYVEPDRRVYPQ